MIGRKVISYYDNPTDVITLAECKAHLDIIRTDQDSLIEHYLGAAISWAGTVLGFSVRRAQTEYYFDRDEITLLHSTGNSVSLRIRFGLRIPANVLDVVSVWYRNENLTYTQMSASDYDYSAHGDHIPMVKVLNVPDNFADQGASYKVVVTEGYYNIGSGSTADEGDLLPYEVKIAILLKLRDLYDFRGNEVMAQTSQLHATAEHYLFPYSKLQIL